MPLPITPVPPFPNVPALPGVPTLPGPLSSVQNNIVLVTSDVNTVLNILNQPPQWGIFNSDGSPAFGAVAEGFATILAPSQSIAEEEFRLDHRISTAPQEQGAFLSYNKVSTPFQAKVSYVVSGTSAQRGIFLAQVLAVQNQINFFTLVMPEYQYPSCDVVHHDYRRDARRGVSMFIVDIWVEQVRVSGTAAYSNTQNPASANPVNGGTVQPQTPTAAQSSAGVSVTMAVQGGNTFTDDPNPP